MSTDVTLYDEVVLKAPTGGGDFPQHPAKPAIFKCVDLINLGKQVYSYQGGPKKIRDRIAYVWLSSEKQADGRNFEMSKEFTNQSSKLDAGLPKFIGTWRGAALTKADVKGGLNLGERVGKIGIGQVLHEQGFNDPTKTYAVVDGVTPLFDGVPVPQFPAYTRATFWGEKKKKYADEVRLYEEETLKNEALRASQQAVAQQLNAADIERLKASVEAEGPTFPSDAVGAESPVPF